MDKQGTRFFLILMLMSVSYLMYSAWQEDQKKIEAKQEEQVIEDQVVYAADEKDLFALETEVLKLKINLKGGNLVYAELKDYKQEAKTNSTNVAVLDTKPGNYQIVQSFLVGEGAPDKTQGLSEYTAELGEEKGGQIIKVTLTPKVKSKKVRVEKIYRFKKKDYDFNVSYRIENLSKEAWRGNFIGQIKRQEAEESQGNSLSGLQMFKGFALQTEDKPYVKLPLKDMQTENAEHTVKGGWMAFVERYFLTAWVSNKTATQNVFSRVNNDVYSLSSLSEVNVPANNVLSIGAKVYVGPEIIDNLTAVAEGLEYTVDYGVFWSIAKPIFWVMQKINTYVNNWGWTIAIIVLSIKLLFFNLSAKSYVSMANAKRIQPQLEAIRKQYADDKQKQGQKMMDLYRKEKVNPLGGCLPLLLQIPVFLALYYVLSESIELRHAPFILWITDLSAKDPYFVLPVLMGLSMVVQQKFSPPPADPMYAKMMGIFPIVLTFVFAWFPAGLVFYWTLNTVLSNIQQWYITNRIIKKRS